jgi:O-antigen ligase
VIRVAFPLSEGHRASALERPAAWAAIAVGFALPISVAADGVLTAAAVVFLLLSGNYRRNFAPVIRNPVALAALVLLGWLALAMAWSEGSLEEAFRHLRKYADLALVALLLPLFGEAARRRAGRLALAAALTLTLAVSLAVYAGGIPKEWLRAPDPTSAIAFKLRVTHGFLMAFGAFLFALLARESAGWPRAGWAALAALAAFNVTWMVHAQTGWLVLAVLAMYLLTSTHGWRGLALAACAVAIVGAAGYFASDNIRARVNETVAQLARETPKGPTSPVSSAALRMEFYRNTAALIADHPVLGTGTGGFGPAYGKRAAAEGRVATDNPHNEYLLMAAQAGLPGLALLLVLFGTAWRLAPRLPTVLERDLARGLVLALASGCLFNSLLLDHTEGLLFAWMSALLFAGLKLRHP